MRTYPTLLAVMAGFLALPQSVPAVDGAAGRSPLVAEAAKKTAKEEMLKQGMAAEAVLELLGKPNAVDPMKAPTGKAEVWTYRTRQEITRERFEIASRPITTLVRGSDGAERQQVIGHEPVYGTRKRMLIRTYQVLMFNDHLLNDKVTVEEVQETQ